MTKMIPAYIFDWNIGPTHVADFPYDLVDVRSLLGILSEH